jgi:methylated-DNA-[protein]-cysteine S-methyltransferase
MKAAQNMKQSFRSLVSVPKIFSYETEIGVISISELGGEINNLFFSNSRKLEINAEIEESELLKEAHAQLDAYFKGRLREFSLPLAPRGTEFQLNVWKALCDIPYGMTKSYKDIAEAVNNPNAYRAVGNANNKNPIPIIIPCHRVIANDGKLSGYGGGISVKEKLLKLESVIF